MWHDWKVDDVIRLRRMHGGGFRVWRVVAVRLGAEGQESVIEISPLDRTKNGATCVPAELLDAALGATVDD